MDKHIEIYPRKQVEIIRQIEQQLRSELQHHPTIKELASEHCMSPTALKATFKGVFGQPIARYAKILRLREAARLLQQTDLSIAQIAGNVGYKSQSKFGAAFAAYAHMTPSDFRKTERNR